jgi:hypothetical protein
MGALALADVLVVFGSRDASPGDFAAFPIGVVPEIAFPDGSALPEADPRDIVRDAVEEAKAELTARLTEEHAAAMEEERGRHASELDALNRQFGEVLGAALTAEMSSVEENVTGIVTAVAARILGPLLTASLQARMVASLAAAIGDAMADAENIRVKVSGSPALYEALCAAAGDKAAFFDFTESATTDLTVRIDDKLIETRLSEWSAAMEEVL